MKNNLKSEKNGATSNTTFSRSIPNEIQSSAGMLDMGDGTNFKDKKLDFQNDIHLSANFVNFENIVFNHLIH